MQLVYDYAEDESAVPEGYNPWRKLRKQDRPSLPKQSRTDFLEIFEAHELIEACSELRDTEIPARELMETFLYTGGRKKEVLGLEVQDIDFERKTVRFVPNQWRGIKDYDERTVPLHPRLEAALRAFLARCGRTAGLLFPGRSRTGVEQMITSCDKAFVKAKAIAVAKLGDVHGPRLAAKSVNPRVFRVTYCSARLQTLDNGFPIAPKTVEGELGHNTGKMIARVYGRLGKIRHRSEHVEYVSREALGYAD